MDEQMIKQNGEEKVTETQVSAENEKNYTQEDVDRIVGERLARERRKATSEVTREEIDALKKDMAEWREGQERFREYNERMSKNIQRTQEEIKAFKEKFPEEAFEEVVKDEKFKKFREGRRGDLASQYADYRELLGDVKKETEKKVNDNVSRSTQSGRFKGSKGEDGMGLTDHQKEIAKLAGMSYEEYSGYLQRIK